MADDLHDRDGTISINSGFGCVVSGSYLIFCCEDSLCGGRFGWFFLLKPIMRCDVLHEREVIICLSGFSERKELFCVVGRK